MRCLIFNLAVVCLTLAGLCYMVGWKTGAGQLARIALALVIGSAVVAWLTDTLRVLFSRPGVQAVAGGLVLLFVVALALFALGRLQKHRNAEKEQVRPTIRRRAQLMDSEEQPVALPLPPSTGTDDLNLFGGQR